MRLAAALAILLVSAASASAQDKPLPKFGDYPVKTIYKGKHAKPKIYGDLKRYYESSYTSAIEGGVTFAGEYAIAKRPCGSHLRDAGHRQREDRQGRRPSRSRSRAGASTTTTSTRSK